MIARSLHHVTTRAILLTAVLGTAACVAEEDETEIGSVASELTGAQMKAQGAYCRYTNDLETAVVCTKCEVDPYCSATHIRCKRYYCDSVDSECDEPVLRQDDWCWKGGYSSYEQAVQFGFEAESVNRYAPMVVGGTTSASNGGYVTVPTSAGAASNLRYTFTADEDFDLYGWARIQVTAPVGPDDTWVSMDNVGGFTIHPSYIGANQWQWVPLADGTTGEHIPFVVTPGEHRFRIYSNATGLRIDRVILSNDPHFVPVTDFHEAESMNVYGPMVKVVPPAATLSNPGYVWVPNGAAAGGEASKVVYVQQSGRFSIWGRVNAPNGSDDSFFVSSDYEQTTTWGTPRTTATGWQWGQVLEFPATAPKLFEASEAFTQFEFLRREDGTKLDRFLVTNDPGFLPVDAPLVVGQP